MYYAKTIIILLLFSVAAVAQDGAPNLDQNVQMKMNMQNSFKGTLDGVISIPRQMRNSVNQLVFPRNFDNGFSMNPWSKKQQKPKIKAHHNYSGQPKGNPWAPVNDLQNIPFDQSAFFEKNPYTDAPVPVPNAAPSSVNVSNRSYGSNQTFNSPFGNGYSNSFDSANTSFSTPFGNQFSPSNIFWPGNNGGSSMPFMPW